MIVDDTIGNFNNIERLPTICGHSGDELDKDFQQGLECHVPQVRSRVLPFHRTPIDCNTDANLQSHSKPVMQALCRVEGATADKI